MPAPRTQSPPTFVLMMRPWLLLLLLLFLFSAFARCSQCTVVRREKGERAELAGLDRAGSAGWPGWLAGWRLGSVWLGLTLGLTVVPVCSPGPGRSRKTAHTKRLKLMATLAAIGKIAFSATSDCTSKLWQAVRQARADKQEQRAAEIRDGMVRQNAHSVSAIDRRCRSFALFVLCVCPGLTLWSVDVLGVRCSRCCAPSSTP